MSIVKKAVEILSSGEVVAIPTETVYGLAADATSDHAVAKIYELKNRPSFNPLIIHVASLEKAEQIAVFNDKARELARKHWPGGLTLVLPKRDKGFAALAGAGLETVAIRCPAHPIALEILRESGLMLAAPSANISGTISPTNAEHVRANFPDIYIVDGGECEVGLESTVIGFDGDKPVLLRHGVLQIEEAGSLREGEEVSSPGMLVKHYAPKSPLRINAEDAKEGEFFIGFGDMECDLNLSEKGDLREAAANLFSALHKADDLSQPIAVAEIPSEGIGLAINDRLQRAAEQ